MKEVFTRFCTGLTQVTLIVVTRSLKRIALTLNGAELDAVLSADLKQALKYNAIYCYWGMESQGKPKSCIVLV